MRKMFQRFLVLLTTVILLFSVTSAEKQSTTDSGDTANTQTKQIKVVVPEPLVDDFEGKQLRWIIVTDTVMGGESTGEISVVEDGADGSKHSVKVSGSVKSKNPFVMFSGLATRFLGGQVLYDVSGYKGIKFWAKGDGNTYRIDLPTASVTDYMYYSFPFTPPENEWKLIKVPFKGLKQMPYGKKVPWTGTDIQGVQIFTVGGPIESFTLQIDEIEFYK